jgi:signal transduction histidine kinase/CheY-like chemotaxis protein
MNNTIAPSPAQGRVSVDERVMQERTRALYANTPINTVGSLACALLLVAMLWAKAAPQALLGWFAAIAAVHVFRLYQWRIYMREQPDAPARLKVWERRYLIAVTVFGAIWGAPAILFYGQVDLVGKTYIALMLCEVVALTVTSVGLLQRAYLIFSTLVALPFLAVSLARGQAVEYGLTFAVAFAYAAALSFTRNVNRFVLEAFRRRFENLDLIDELARQKDIAEHASRTKTQFLAAASHDLRQPLQALGLFVMSVKLRARDPEMQAAVSRIERSMGALEGVLEALLDVSKLDAGVVSPRIEPFPLARVFAAVREQFAATADWNKLRFAVKDTDTWCTSDPYMLERIVANLVSNALRYTKQGSVVVGCRRAGKALRIEVWDTGPGIPADKQAEIFREFVQLDNPERSRDKGLGLGLAIVERLCRLLDHRLALRSTVGRGSVFSVTVPRAVPTAAAAAAAVPPPAGSLAGRFVLVIDDDREVLAALEEVLELNGAHPIAVPSEAAAREMLGDLGRAPDLIVSDYRLAAGAVGIEVVQALQRDFGPQTPGAILTGDIAPNVLKAVADAGLPLLSKPIHPEQLIAALERVLGARESAVAT